MRDETSLEHERVFKQLYYHSLPFDQIVYSFLLSLSLFNRKFYQPFSAVPERFVYVEVIQLEDGASIS